MGPIDMVLYCPACGVQHIDAPEPLPPSTHRHQFEMAGGRSALWTNPPHRSHLCHSCGHIWRPADVPTNGVLCIQTRGSADSLKASSAGNTMDAAMYQMLTFNAKQAGFESAMDAVLTACLRQAPTCWIDPIELRELENGTVAMVAPIQGNAQRIPLFRQAPAAEASKGEKS